MLPRIPEARAPSFLTVKCPAAPPPAMTIENTTVVPEGGSPINSTNLQEGVAWNAGITALMAA
jgi:hypothetical protein